MTTRLLALTWMALFACPACSAATNDGEQNSADEPQLGVACTGWHALCGASTDCKMRGEEADCACLRVNETHIVEATEIQDPELKRQTLARCTNAHPCAVDEAPVCQAIRARQYQVNGVHYDWVSTYSYRGWCSLVRGFVPCDPGAPGYVGDSYWAICDVAPCTEIENPSDPERPLSCRCRVKTGPFVGTNGSCTGDDGGIMSSFPLSQWDFRNGTYPIPVPGYEYVKGACAPPTSDPAPAPASGASHRAIDSPTAP